VPTPSTDISLLYDVRQGTNREEAWAAFQARYRDVIVGWCVRRGLSAHGAEDLTQEVLLKLFEHLPRYSHDPARGRFRGWLKVVVNNALTDLQRRQRRRPEPGGVGGTAFQGQLAGLVSPEAAAELSQVIEGHALTAAAEVVERVRAKLKETTWQAFYQTMVEQRAAAEIAADLGLSVASVYKATYRVKQMLLQEYDHVRDHGAGRDALSGPSDAPQTPV
jgi:RNA polymerase sigma-70 factor (ECF subfamily)